MPRKPAALGSKVWAFILGVDVLAIGLVATVSSIDDQPFVRPWLLVGFALFLALDHGGFSTSVLHVSQSERIGLEEAAIVTMAFIFPPYEILLCFLGSVIVGELASRKSPVKMLFNVGQMAICGGLGLMILFSAGVPSAREPLTIAAAAAGAIVFFAINSISVSILFSLIERRPLSDVIRFRSELPRLASIGSVALGILTGIASEVSGTALLIGLAAALILEAIISKEHGAQRDRERTSRLLDASLKVSSTFDPNSVVDSVLAATRTLLQCEEARLSHERPRGDEIAAETQVAESRTNWLVAGKPLSDGGFTDRDHQVLKTLAAVCSTALTNASLFRQVQIERTRLEESQAELLRSQKLEAIGRLAGGIAHDFNNMLAVIMTSAELARDEIDGDHAAQEDLNEVIRTVERAAGLVSQLLTFARKKTTQPEPIHLGHLVEEMDKMLRRVVGETIDLKLTIDPHVPAVVLDTVHAEQIVVNLVVNARDASPAGGSVTVEVSRHLEESLTGSMEPGEYGCLSVCDGGEGMDEATISRIFDPFFTTKPIGRGTGLGLSTVYGIVERAGGQVRVDSKIGVGTTVSIYLPVVAADTPDALSEMGDWASLGREADPAAGGM